jgi:hypothetical protein
MENITSFSRSLNYLTKEEKVKLLQSIQFYPTLENGTISSHLMPMFCFDKNHCYFEQPFLSCPLRNYDKDDCPVCKDKEKLKKGLNDFAAFLYTMRNNFVHNAHLPPLAPPLEPIVHKGGATMSMSTATHIHHKFTRRRPNYDGWILLDLSVNHLEKILNRNFKKLLDKYVETRNQNNP